MTRPRVAVVVVAAGSGTRLGADEPKAFVLLDRETMLRHALRGVLAARPAQVVVVAPAGREDDARRAAVRADEALSAVVVVVGYFIRRSARREKEEERNRKR